MNDRATGDNRDQLRAILAYREFDVRNCAFITAQVQIIRS
jgi:hypothetical protein